MPSVASTRINFRRDLRFFFIALVGFLVVIILALVLLLVSVIGSLERSEGESRQRLAEAAERELRVLAQAGTPSQLEVALSVIHGRLDLAFIRLEPSGRAPIVRGDTTVPSHEITRRTPLGNLVLGFDDSATRRLRTTFRITAALCVGSAILGTILLLLYLPRITRPMEELLDHASRVRAIDGTTDEPAYLVDTFRETIDRLRVQEEQLKHLHEVEKSRADDLERITSTLTRSLTSGFLALDASGRVVDMNVAAREILQIEPGAEIPEGTFLTTLRESLEGRRALSRNEIVEQRNDVPLVIGLTTVPLLGDDGGFLGMLALFTDLTPIRQLERRLREVQTLADLGEISGGIAHEFRNSLSAVLGFLKLARRQAGPEQMEQKITSAEEEATQLLQAVDALLAFARPMSPALQPVDLREVAGGVIDRIGQQIEDVRFELRGGPLSVAGDPTLLARALENLLRNAADSVRAARAEGESAEGHVRVITSDDALIVEDDGVGLDPADVPRLYLPFQSDRPGGYGLGLPLARKIVLLHGGILRLTGTPGGGAKAIIEFPPETILRERGGVA
ncbi:MAG TPA: ATP-binding protein [Thermoanaerobaculia bacterium]|nr:ATP-binding protein [Thermoanaerobaculia bacterium]